MFTGIITHKGKIKATTKNKLVIESSLAKDLNVGDSISVNGICLTVVETNAQDFLVDFIDETMDKTNIGKLQSDNSVNLELPATPTSFLSGHIVQGHVDTTAVLQKIEQLSNQKTLIFELDQDLSKYMVDKGSITINGVSLTLINVDGKTFRVGIIPHTWDSTMLHELKTGDGVNIEVDVLSKYIEKLTKGSNG